MSKPTSHRINCDDNATAASPSNHMSNSDTEGIDTNAEDYTDEFRRKNSDHHSPVTFYIESESSKVSTRFIKIKTIELCNTSGSFTCFYFISILPLRNIKT